MSTLKVDAIRHNSATSDAITTAADGTCTAKLTSVGGAPLSNRNKVINGAMNVAQRGVTSTSVGYQTIDRQNAYSSGTDVTPTQAQVDVSSGTGPYNDGFRKAIKITNGNQTSGAQAGSRVLPQYKFEGQDLVNSGWDHTSSSSYITIQFWVKSSVAQTYYGYLRSQDGTGQIYTYSVALSADTWTKVVKTIPGNSNVQIDNDNGEGIQWNILIPFAGTNYTDSGVSLNTWNTYAGGTRTPDNTSTWYTTNDATFEYTGLQVEVGDTATSFEHRSYGDELARCQRYYYQFEIFPNQVVNFLSAYGSTYGKVQYSFPVTMRANPTGGLSDISGVQEYLNGTWNNRTLSIAGTRKDFVQIFNERSDSGFGGQYVRASSGTPICTLNAEL